MKILVTGGAGFIGSHIVETYLKEKHEVVVVDDLSSGKKSNLPPGVRFYETDIRDSELSQIFKEEHPDVVNHQAARANVRESFDKPLLYASVNILGSVNILECCKEYGVKKVIYASTGGAVYGEPEQLPVPEEHPINPLDPYGASKHHVEHYLHLYMKNFGIEYTALRYPNVYGPRQDPHGEAGVVAIFTDQMLGGSQPLINGKGNQERDFVHVKDVARASLLSLDRGDGKILNIGDGRGTSVNQIYEILSELTGFGRPARYGPAKKGEVYRIFLNADQAKKHLGWESLTSLGDGLKSTVDFFRSTH